MKHLLLTTIAAVVLVGCGPSVHEATAKGNIEAVKQYLAAGVDVNAKDWGGKTLDGRQQVAQINVSDIVGVLFLIAMVLCPIIFFAGIIALIIWAVKKGKGSGKGGSYYGSGYYGNSCSSDSSSSDSSSSDSSSSDSSSSCGSSCGGCGGGD